jgi:hypothetical protein
VQQAIKFGHSSPPLSNQAFRAFPGGAPRTTYKRSRERKINQAARVAKSNGDKTFQPDSTAYRQEIVFDKADCGAVSKRGIYASADAGKVDVQGHHGVP